MQVQSSGGDLRLDLRVGGTQHRPLRRHHASHELFRQAVGADGQFGRTMVILIFDLDQTFHGIDLIFYMKRSRSARVGEYRRYSIGDTVRYSNFE